MFDATRPITINLRTPGGVKTVRVRFPSDDEWIARQRRRKVLVKQLGREISETTVDNGEEPEIDPLEAMQLVKGRRSTAVDVPATSPLRD